jgi:hypothetical protein
MSAGASSKWMIRILPPPASLPSPAWPVVETGRL